MCARATTPTQCRSLFSVLRSVPPPAPKVLNRRPLKPVPYRGVPHVTPSWILHLLLHLHHLFGPFGLMANGSGLGNLQMNI